MNPELDLVLAGPFLRWATAVELRLWLATSQPIDPKAMDVELWDPALAGVLAFDQPVLTQFETNRVELTWTAESRQLTTHLFVHVLRITPARPLLTNKIYGYRVVMYPSPRGLGEPVPVPIDPPGTVERLAVGAPNKQPFASFVLPQPTTWWALGIPSASFVSISDAADAFAAAVKPPAGKAIAAPQPGASSVVFFGNPFTLRGEEDVPQIVFDAIEAVARRLVGTTKDPVERMTARFAAGWLLAWSPALWTAFVGEASSTDDDDLTRAVNATATLMANVPTRVLGAGDVLPAFIEHATGQSRSSVDRAFDALSARTVATWFADWPSAPVLDVTVADVALVAAGTPYASAYVSPERPPVAVANTGVDVGTLLGAKALPDRIVQAVSADTVLAGPDGAMRAPPDATAVHDVTLVLSCAPAASYVLESGAPFQGPPPARFGTESDGTPYGKVIEVAAGFGGALPAATPTRDVEVSLVAQAADPRYASIRRAGGTALVSLEPLAKGESVYPVPLPAHGRVYPVDGRNPGLHVGNRFWTQSSRPKLADGDRKPAFLKNIEVNLYQGGAAVPVVKGKTDASGWVDRFALDGVADGDYTLKIEGRETWDHAGPDTPVTTGVPGAFKDRVWLRESFPVRIEHGAIVTIDHEPVPGTTFRLLVDPVWMHAAARATWHRTGRTVSLIVLHRTDEGGPSAGNAASDASAWQVPASEKKGAHYLLARDGTLVKCCDESESVGQAGANAATSWAGHDALNDRSIGIEIAKDETWGPFTHAQYASLVRLLRRYGTTTRSDVHVTPVDIVGHSDIRLETDSRHKVRLPPHLGGRNDPGLAFDWTYLERRGLGLRRSLQEVPALFAAFPDPPATLEASRKAFNAKSLADRKREARVKRRPSFARVTPTPPWAAEISKALRSYATLYPPGTPQATIDAQLVQDLTDIGYLAAPGVVLEAAIKAFRSHFFSGPRRTWYCTKIDGADDPYIWSTEEETGPENADARKLTTIWAHQVADYVRAARAKADPKDATYDGENGWKVVRDAEATETDRSTLP